MLTGRAPFAGDTVSDTIAKILEREPDWTAMPASTPDPIRQLLVRCLAKDQKRRLRDIGEARIAIDALDDAARAPLQAVAIPSPSRPGARWLPWAAVAALLAAVAVWEVARPRGSDDPFAAARIVRLTNWEGNEEAVEISPDGKFIAFLSDLTGEFDIWLNQVGTNHFSNLTREMPALAPGGAIVRKLGFSGNGAEIWFNPESRKPLLLMPLTGGPARTLLGEGANTPAWSPDGRRLVYFGKPPDGADPMFIADRSGADARQLVGPHAGMKRNNPVWSEDGQWIYFVSGSEPQDEMNMDVWRVRASGGSPERLTSMHAAANFLAPIDARTVLYTARAEDGSGPWLWALDVARKASRRVALGVDQVTSVAASRDGRRVVATVANPSVALWRVPLLSDRLADEREAGRFPLPAPTGRAMAPRFGDRVMFYLSGRSTSDGLWKVQDDRASEVWRDADGPLAEPAAVSPDSSQLAVVVRRDGRRLLSILAADGTNSRTVAPSIEVEGAAGQGAASWSPDGRWIVTGGRDARGPALFKIPVDDGPPERLVEGKWVNPVWSPKGDLIVYSGRSLVGRVTLLAVHPDGTPVALPEVWVRPGGYRFRPDGSGLVYIPGIHATDFWLFDVASQSTRPLTRLSNAGLLRTFDITPDGAHIVFDRSRENSDIVLIDRGPR
jgi:Tol biopolymer transport system component